MLTPATKSSMESAGEALFFPRLTASIASSRRAARSGLCDRKGGILARMRDRTNACPCEGKPYLLITAESCDRRKKRGRGFPGYRVKMSCTLILLVMLRVYLGGWSDAPNFNPAETKVK